MCVHLRLINNSKKIIPQVILAVSTCIPNAWGRVNKSVTHCLQPLVSTAFDASAREID